MEELVIMLLDVFIRKTMLEDIMMMTREDKTIDGIMNIEE